MSNLITEDTPDRAYGKGICQVYTHCTLNCLHTGPHSWETPQPMPTTEQADLVRKIRDRMGGTGWQKPLTLADALLIQHLCDTIAPP